MTGYPKNQLEFERWFSSEDACREYLVRVRWPEGIDCPRCGGKKLWITKRKLYHCAVCGHEVSVTAGTLFQDTRKPLQLWFRAMWYVVGQKNGVSALGLQKVMGMSRYETVWIWLHKLRTAMVRPTRERLSGVVEVDETYIGGEGAGKRGRGAEGKTLVLVAAEDKEDHIGRIRLQQIPDASGESLISAIGRNVEPGSHVRTDSWGGYNQLGSTGYTHTREYISGYVGDNLLPLTNRVASQLKRWLQGTHQGAVRDSHLDYYLDEFTFRFNRRTSRSRGKLFHRLIQQAVASGPTKGDDIRGNGSFQHTPDMGST